MNCKKNIVKDNSYNKGSTLAEISDILCIYMTLPLLA